MNARRARIAALLAGCPGRAGRAGKPRIVNWNELKAAIIQSELGREKINWLEVRSVLQDMIEKGSLTRTSDVSTEDYTIS